MSQPHPGDPDADPPPGRSQPPWVLIALGGAAVLVLLIGFLVWIGGGDDEITSTTTATTTTATATSVVATSSEVSTTLPATTTSTPATTTTTPATTAPATTIAPTTTVPEPPTSTMPAGPSGDTWTITSQYFPNDPFTLARVTQIERLSAYDGVIDVGPPGVRCVAIVIEGDDGWSEWCGDPGQAFNFVVLDGIDPWLAEVGAESGIVALTRQQPWWALPTNGCTAPIGTLIAALSPGPAVLTGIICVPGEAFVSYSSVLLQPGPPDGGGALLEAGDEGWDSSGGGTSFGCEDFNFSDGVDRCALYGVEFELFEAVLPIPPNEALSTATDITGMRDETAEVQAWVGAETEPPEIEGIILDFLVDADAEVPADIRRATGVSYAAALNLVIVEVAAMDDSILSNTWAIWIDTATPSPLVRVSAWESCARGLDVPSGLCV